MKNFRQLQVWQKSMDLVSMVYDFVLILPHEEKYGLRSQITRSAVSIPSNIAEGSSRKSDKDYQRFLAIALGSSFELETQLLITKKLGITEETLTPILTLLDEVQKMLNSFISKLNQSISH